jgi:hypothetical protein
VIVGPCVRLDHVYQHLTHGITVGANHAKIIGVGEEASANFPMTAMSARRRQPSRVAPSSKSEQRSPFIRSDNLGVVPLRGPMETDRPDPQAVSLTLQRVLESAAQLQQAVPDAVLVGGTAAALYARHRDSFDHDHVLGDLQERYFQVLEAVEATDGWVTNVSASAPPLTILGRLGGIEAGLRQLRRRRPLETQEVRLGATQTVQVPTAAETLRIKAYLVVQRNQVRDYLDVVALTDRYGIASSASVLASIDDYYTDRSQIADSVLTALVEKLSAPAPKDERVTRQLERYRRLDPRWHDWATVAAACQVLADALLRKVEQG